MCIILETQSYVLLWVEMIQDLSIKPTLHFAFVCTGVVLETQVQSFGSHKQVQADSEGGNRDGKDGARSVTGAGTVTRESITALPRCLPYTRLSDVHIEKLI